VERPNPDTPAPADPPSPLPAGGMRGRNFCPDCGGALRPADHFCTTCGFPTPPEAAVDSGLLPSSSADAQARGALGWWVAGALLVTLILLVALPVVNPPQPPGGGGAPVAPGTLGPAPNVDLSSMTPREAADNLFNRVMRAMVAGDSTEVFSFVPMAIAAYERARPLDADGHFHLSLLQAVALDFPTSLETAEGALVATPDHLLLLSAAAGAAAALGDTARARRYYQHALAVFDDQLALELPEYEEHSPLLPILRREALEFLQDR